MCDDLKILKQGAEAKLYICNYIGKPTLIKERFEKKYRQPELDVAITKERIKNEARAIVRCKTADVKTPALYLVDFERRRIYMQHFTHSITVKDFIIDIFTKQQQNGSGDGPNNLDKISVLIGQTVRKLHENNIIHGDLTTSNMLLVHKNSSSNDNWLDIDNVDLVMIDFGLSSFDTSAEDKGVDLYVLERALISTHNDYPEIFSKILEAYKSYSKNNVKEIISKFEEVRARGRKRTMVG
ncbi:EKC/KEOPS complex subunit TP53RK [Leguminivora glycinivorella]|uniref:EKC/KEOPS complex subunit TP53RK n=1 Tax=Leguminivora glycinivorella TaxID=1035111 RepID=UPI002010588D|nr:EKC/KEOPS complex subunit TP53RK [Leguminivora glycinivorella]